MQVLNRLVSYRLTRRGLHALFPLLLTMLALAVASPLRAATIHVDSSNPNCPGDGSASNPFCLIQDGIAAALAGDVVEVAPGTYDEQIDFLGKAISVISRDGPGVTTIDGGSVGSAVTFASGEGPSSLLEGFTIIGGNGTPDPLFYNARFGGGIYCNGASPTISGNDITHQSYPDFGGGIHCGNGSDALIINNTIHGCRTSGAAGISCWASSPFIQGCDIHDNLAAGSGGAIDCKNSNATITLNTIRDNQAAEGGAVMMTETSNITITGNTISGSLSDEDSMGAIACREGHATIEGNDFSNNLGYHGAGDITCTYLADVLVRYNTSTGGGIGVDAGGISATIESNTFSDHLNYPAVQVQGGETTVEGNTFTGNAAAIMANPTLTAPLLIAGNSISGGAWAIILDAGSTDIRLARNNIYANSGLGIYCSSAGASITDNAVWNNGGGDPWRNAGVVLSATSSVALDGNTIFNNQGAGILYENAATATITGSIIWNNPDGEIVVLSGSPTVTYSDVKGGWAGTGNIDADPSFVDRWSGNFDLQNDSPCIDRGDSVADRCTDRDLPGRPRRLDGRLDLDARIDMGACEFDNVHLEITGAATPGGTLTLTSTGTTGLSAMLFIGLAPGAVCHPRFGALFLDLTAPWFLLAWPPVPSTVSGTIPSDTPVPLPLVFQELVLQGIAGNTSAAVEITVE